MHDSTARTYRPRLTQEEFTAWLSASKPRPAYCMGNPARKPDTSVESDNWLPFTQGALTLAGAFDDNRHGAYAHVYWHPPDKNYSDHEFWWIPLELRVQDPEQLWAAYTGVGFRVRKDNAMALLDALRRGAVERRFTWDPDPEAPLRIATRALWTRRQHDYVLRDALTQFVTDLDEGRFQQVLPAVLPKPPAPLETEPHA